MRNIFNKFKKQEGFTLLELLIVIVIIGILAVLIIPNLAQGPQRARDSQRKSDLRNIKTALETYYNDYQGYPNADGAITGLDSTLEPTYMKEVPQDPREAQGHTDYQYYTTSAPASGTCSTTCDKYVLEATLENDNDPDTAAGTTDKYRVESAN